MTSNGSARSNFSARKYACPNASTVKGSSCLAARCRSRAFCRSVVAASYCLRLISAKPAIFHASESLGLLNVTCLASFNAAAYCFPCSSVKACDVSDAALPLDAGAVLLSFETGAPTGVEAVVFSNGVFESVVDRVVFLLALFEFPEFAGSTSSNGSDDLSVEVEDLSVFVVVWREVTRRGRVEPDCAWAVSAVKIKSEAKVTIVRCR